MRTTSKRKASGAIAIIQASSSVSETSQMIERFGICDANPEGWPSAWIRIQAALRLLTRNAPAIRTVKESVRVVVTLGDGRNLADGAGFSSTSFGEQPGHIYLSSSAQAYLPPSTCLSALSDYALAENLYHEALHQELFRVWRSAPLTITAENKSCIYVPWRQTEWTVSHAMQAAYVYSHLHRTRRELAKEHTKQWDSLADQARLAAEILTRALAAKERSLTVRGRLVLRRMVGLIK